jgi:hypothetical protein
MTDYSSNELNAAEDPAPDQNGAAPPPLPTQRVLRPTFLEQFLMGNYFYVFSAVAIMLGCYLLITAPFITGTVFMRTLKSFLVLQGYEFLLLGSAALITVKIGRGGDVVTLFLIGLVLLLDPTFFGNAFYTIRQGVNPIVPPLVCGISLVLAIGKFEAFRRLLGLQVSGRYIVGFLLAASIVWLSGLLLTRDIPRADATAYSYLLAWVPLMITAVVGEPRNTLRLPESAGHSLRWPPFLIVATLPVLCAMHQVELSNVMGVPYHAYLMGPLLITVAFALVRAARPGYDEGPLYTAADVFLVFAVLVSLSAGRSGPVVGGMQMPALVYVMLAGVGVLYGYGYLKHHSTVARYHLLVYAVVAALTAFVVLIVKFVVPLLRDIQLPPIPEWLFSFRSFITVLTLVLSWLAWKKKMAVLWLIAAFCAIVSIFGFIPGGYTVWLAEMLQLCFISMFVYFYLRGPDLEQLRKLGMVIVALALVRYVLFPHTVATGVLLAISIVMMILSRHLRDSTFAIYGIIGFVVLGFNGIKYILTSVHPSLIALAVGTALFGIGLWVTFQKQKLLARMNQAGENAEQLPPGFEHAGDNAADTPTAERSSEP